MISDKKLIQWNNEGLIPGPHEDEKMFLDRVKYCHSLKENIETVLPFQSEEKAPENSLSGNSLASELLFGITPKWIPIYYSNYQLSSWHGGCAWIFQVDEHTPTGALVQLRQSLRNSSRYLKLYSFDELLAHELTHVGRMTFHENKFEEFHAYRTSNSSFRKWFGPFFRYARETRYFLFLLIVVLFINLTMAQGAGWINALPPLFIFAGLIRLLWSHQQYARCLNQLEKIFPGNSLKVNYRLTDMEIEEFGRMNVRKIKNYIKQQKSLRWRAILAAYPF